MKVTTDIYKNLIQKADFGFAEVRLLRDNKSSVTDFVFIEVNESFLFHTLLNREEIFSSRGSGIFKKDHQFYQWLSMLRKATRNSQAELEYCINDCLKWLKVKTHFISEESIAIIVYDISELHKQTQVVETFSNHAEEFLTIYHSELDYQRIINGFRTLAKARFAILNLNSDDNTFFQSVAISGDGDMILKAGSMLGYNLIGKKWKYDPLRFRRINENLVSRFNSLSSLADSIIPRSLIVMMESLFHIGQCIIVKIMYEENYLGDVTFIMNRGEFFTNDSLVKLYAGQLGAMIQRKKMDEMLAEKKFALEELNHSLEDRIQQAVEENRQKDHVMALQARHAAMGEMIANIAHQWRQPLSSINLIVWDLMESFKNKELDYNSINEFYLHISSIIQHMSQTIDDFRDFFNPRKEKTEFDLNKTIENALSFLSANFMADNIKTQSDLEDKIVLWGYPNELVQVFINILNNAREVFVLNQVMPRLITIKTWKEESCCFVMIQNNGGHIPQKYFERVFEPYFTTKHHQNGTGLGLYMAKTIVEKNMEGKLTVTNLNQNEVAFLIELKLPHKPAKKSD